MDMEREKQKEMEDKPMNLKGAGMILKLVERGGGRPSTSTPTIAWLSTSTITSVSARKLCATLWEIHPHELTPKLASKMKKKKKKKTKEILNGSPEQPANASSSRRHVANSRDAQQPLSSSSMKVAPLNLVESPTKFLDFRGRAGKSNYSLKTSAELRKVLGRILSLEEKQSCNMSSLKSLKTELKQSHSQIKDLLKEKQSNRQEMNCLMMQVAGDQVSKKTAMEQDKFKAVIQSARAEVESERKLRKHSESLHRKLTRELSQVKSAFSSAIKELERERKARTLLENLCDEFAKGIRDYEQEVRSLRNKSDMDHVDRRKSNRLILHISEAWLDERMQTRLEENQQNGVSEKNAVVDKLSPNIETFLQARHSNGLRKNRSLLIEAINNFSRRESFPLNDAVSAPQDAPDGEDSMDSDSRCFELNKSTSYKQNTGRRQRNLNLNERMLDKLNRKQSVSSEGDKVNPVDSMNEDSYAHQASRKQETKSKLASPEINKSKSPLHLPSGIKENTLQAKLLEARLEGRKYRSTTSAGSKIH